MGTKVTTASISMKKEGLQSTCQRSLITWKSECANHWFSFLGCCIRILHRTYIYSASPVMHFQPKFVKNYESWEKFLTKKQLRGALVRRTIFNNALFCFKYWPGIKFTMTLCKPELVQQTVDVCLWIKFLVFLNVGNRTRCQN